MSAEDQGGAGRREVAYRLFAAEFDDADFSYSESEEERAPNYVVTPTGARVNRLFAVGVLTEVEAASEDVLRARIVDPTGAFVVYAGQYQPEAQAFFERAEPPAFVAVTGKARTFQPEDSEVTYTSVRPENVNEVDAETRDRWTVQAARQTLARVGTMARALQREERGEDLRRALESEGVDVGLAAGIPLALDHYGTTPAYLDSVRELAIRAAEVVSGERGEVEVSTVAPDAEGDVNPAVLTGLELSDNVGGESAGGLSTDVVETGTESAEPESTTPTAESETSTEPETETATADTSEDAAASATDGSQATATGESAAESAAASDESLAGAESTTAGATDPEPSEGAETATESSSAVDQSGTESTAGATESDDELGDFEPGDFDADEFELDEQEREEIEQEYGTEFQTGTEVDEPGEAGIETPDPEPDAESATESAGEQTTTGTAEPDENEPATDEQSEPEPADTGETDADETSEPESGETPETEPAETTDSASEEADELESAAAGDQEPADVDIEDAVMDAMRERDEGDGASEDEIVEAVTAEYGFEADAVADAIQDALMDGRCYEPEDGVFKPI